MILLFDSSAKHRRALHAERLRVLWTHIRPKAQELVLALADAAEKEFVADLP